MSNRSMTKSPLAVAGTALKTAQGVLPAYSHPKSPQKYTQHQLFAILALKEFFRTDFRGITAILREWSDLREVLDLQKVPHYSTLCYARRRLLKKGAIWTCWAPLFRQLRQSGC